MMGAARFGWVFLMLLGAGLGSACSGGGGDGGDADADADADADGDGDADADADGDCDPPDPQPATPPRGQVRLVYELAEGADRAIAQFSSTDPIVWHREVLREGDCRLLETDATYCFDCPQGTCVGGECVAIPELLSAGTVSIDGLARDVVLEDVGGPYWADLSQAPLEPGAAITVSATGGEHPAFEVQAPGPAPLDVELPNGEVVLVDGQDLVLRWTPAQPCDARVHLQILSATAAHGLPPVVILECDVPDTGELVVPQALVEAFPEQERRDFCVLVDCPASTIARTTRAAVTAGEGREVELRVEAAVTFAAVHTLP